MTTETPTNGTLRLYELAPAYRALIEAIDNLADGDSEAEANLAEMAERIADDIAVKADSIAAIVHQLDLTAEAYDAEIKRLQARKAAVVGAQQRLKDYLKTSLVQAGLKKVQGRRFSVSVADAPPSVDVVNEAEIPEQFWRVKREVDRRAILEHWREHQVLPLGVRLTTGVSLRIR